MSKALPVMLAALALVSARESVATWVRPDAQFAFSVPVADAKVAVDEIAAALEPLKFKLTLSPPAKGKPGFVGAEFLKRYEAAVLVSGLAACIRVAIYTLSPDQSHEMAMSRAAELSAYLVAHLRSRDGVLLFKSSGQRSACEEAL